MLPENAYDQARQRQWVIDGMRGAVLCNMAEGVPRAPSVVEMAVLSPEGERRASFLGRFYYAGCIHYDQSIKVGMNSKFCKFFICNVSILNR